MRKLLILITLCLPVVVSFIEYEVKAEIETMNQEQLLTEIQDERGRELALEGQRWFDLRRTTRPRIEKSFLDMNYEEHSAVLEKDDSRYVIRFPKEAIANNPNLAN